MFEAECRVSGRTVSAVLEEITDKNRYTESSCAIKKKKVVRTSRFYTVGHHFPSHIKTSRTPQKLYLKRHSSWRKDVSVCAALRG